MKSTDYDCPASDESSLRSLSFASRKPNLGRRPFLVGGGALLAGASGSQLLRGLFAGGTVEDQDTFLAPLLPLARERPIPLRPFSAVNHVTIDKLIAGNFVFSALHDWNPMPVPVLLHRLKLARIADEEVPMSYFRSTLQVLLSDSLCKQQTSSYGGHYLLTSKYGVRPTFLGSADSEGLRGETHFGQLLMNLGEAGVSRDEPVFPYNSTQATVGDILVDAVSQYSPEKEQEFIVPALAMWLPDGVASWTNRFKNSFTFDEAVSRLIDAPNNSACGGTHRLYAIAIVLNCDLNAKRLSPRISVRAWQYLKRSSSLLEERQASDGGWMPSWNPDVASPHLWGSTLLDKLTIDGHHLEWMAYVPENARVSAIALQRTVESLVANFENLPDINYRTFKYQLPLSHAARALCALGGYRPVEALEAFHRPRVSCSHERDMRCVVS